MGSPGTATPMQLADGDGIEARTSAAGRLRTGLFYGAVVAAGVFVLWAILHAGAHLHAPHASSDTAVAAGASAEKVIWRLLLASAVILIVARLVGAVFQRINQPQVVGEIIAGILLGPSVLGAIAPQATHYLFPD